jgi:hypothetical protein
LGNRLAQGGFGTVFEGIDARNMKNIIVKIVRLLEVALILIFLVCAQIV